MFLNRIYNKERNWTDGVLDQNIEGNICTYNKVKRAIEKLSMGELHSAYSLLQSQSISRPCSTNGKDDKGIKYFRL